jgi:hypothetical protein
MIRTKMIETLMIRKKVIRTKGISKEECFFCGVEFYDCNKQAAHNAREDLLYVIRVKLCNVTSYHFQTSCIAVLALSLKSQQLISSAPRNARHQREP